MRNIRNELYAGGMFIPAAIKAWAAAALILLALSSLLISGREIRGSAVGYFTSALSFLTAVAAGSAAGRVRKAGALYTGALCGAVITTALLTVGFIIKGAELPAEGVLSVASFTFAGCLFGSVFFSGFGRKAGGKRRRKFT